MKERMSIYIQLKDGLSAKEGDLINIENLATILMSNTKIKEKILKTPILRAEKRAPSYIVVSVLTIIEKIQEQYGQFNIYPVGNSEILVTVGTERKPLKKSWIVLKVFAVSCVLFIGTGLAIMNFHADVNMEEAHQKIYKMITGIDNNRPLLLQIPYSFGIGIGMAIFFNHIIPKKIRDEPSPMEIEMYSYRKSVSEYVLNNTKNTEENTRS